MTRIALAIVLVCIGVVPVAAQSVLPPEPVEIGATPLRTGAIGLVTIRKEGFVSLRGPSGGGVVCTRVLRWPGGKLYVNAAAKDGAVTVRVSSPNRKAIPGFDHTDNRAFHGDSIAAEITWKERSLDELQGQSIRLEFFIQNADLYSFRADPSRTE